MINGGSATQHRQRNRQPNGRRCHTNGDRCDTHAQKKHDHHRATPPQIAQAPGGQCAQPETEECRHAIRHEVLPTIQSEVFGNRGNRCGENQQKHVINGMTDVQQ